MPVALGAEVSVGIDGAAAQAASRTALRDDVERIVRHGFGLPARNPETRRHTLVFSLVFGLQRLRHNDDQVLIGVIAQAHLAHFEFRLKGRHQPQVALIDLVQIGAIGEALGQFFQELMNAQRQSAYLFVLGYDGNPRGAAARL